MAQITTGVFLDTSALYALHDARDAHHESARRILENLMEEGAPLHTHEWVAVETLQLVRKRLGSNVSVAVSRVFQENPALTLHFMTPEWWKAILTRYETRPALGMADLASFTLMERLRLTQAFAFDEDFSSAGFRLLSA